MNASTDLVQLIYQIWHEKVRPLVEKDPDELARRLARRRLSLMRRPPRAWCLVVRASDSRINPAMAAIVPEHAAYPRAAQGRALRGYLYYDRHEVTLTARLLRWICRPVATPIPGVDARTLAGQLGTTQQALMSARQRGAFSVHYVRGLHGRWGHPVPVLYSKELLDPCSDRGAPIDPLWGTTWRYVADHVPDELCQTIERVPMWRERLYRSPKYGEHLAEVFSGWLWICPSCKRSVRRLFYPLPPLHIVRLLLREFHEIDANHADAWTPPPPTFACAQCHRVQSFSRWRHSGWNQLVAHMTGGLLYGHEVPQPDWARPQGAPSPRSRPRRSRAPRMRELVRADIRAGLTFKQIARKRGIAPASVQSHARVMYREYGVRGMRELRVKLAIEELFAGAQEGVVEKFEGEEQERLTLPADFEVEQTDEDEPVAQAA